jgi:thiamine-monophosphate kinase
VPFGYLLTLVLRKTVREKWLRSFARGLAADQRAFDFALLGGDMSSTSGPLTITVAAIGYVPRGKAILRSGAKPGDLVFVSGTIGDSGAGLGALTAKTMSPHLISRFRVPQPRLALGMRLRGVASAALDVSDGLLADLGHLAEASKVHIAIDAARIPLSVPLQKAWGKSEAAIVRAATSGDDYEIAFTTPEAKRAKVMAAGRAARVRVTEIGCVMKGRDVVIRDALGVPIPVHRAGYTHF